MPNLIPTADEALAFLTARSGDDMRWELCRSPLSERMWNIDAHVQRTFDGIARLDMFLVVEATDKLEFHVFASKDDDGISIRVESMEEVGQHVDTLVMLTRALATLSGAALHGFVTTLLARMKQREASPGGS